MMADSTSRWAEALREIASRLEEMPAEEGYPPYLASRLAAFYERAGRVTTLAGEGGSVSVIGAVSPAGGDLSEPVTQSTLRITGAFWALDAKLARARHFPAINWAGSYSLFTNILEPWYRTNIANDYPEIRTQAIIALQREAGLQEVVQLVGPDALQDAERLDLEIGRLFREDFLQQNGYDKVDASCSMSKGYGMLQMILALQVAGKAMLAKGGSIQDFLSSTEMLEKVGRARFVPENEFEAYKTEFIKSMDTVFAVKA
jgi:V/A-type H+-transporting ATPase subunit A